MAEADARTFAEIVMTVHGASVKDAAATLLTIPMVAWAVVWKARLPA